MIISDVCRDLADPGLPKAERPLVHGRCWDDQAGIPTVVSLMPLWTAQLEAGLLLTNVTAAGLAQSSRGPGEVILEASHVICKSQRR